METVKDINRWWTNPMRRLLGSIECRNLRRHKVFAPCRSRPVQSRHRFSSLDACLHVPVYGVKHSRVCHSGIASTAMLEDRFRCLGGSGDRLSGQTPCTSIDRSKKMFLYDGCRDIVERICRIVSWE